MSRCAIDQIQTVAGFRCQLVEESLPDAPARPAVEPIVGCCVRPVAFRQIAPRHTRAQHVEDRIQDPTIIDTRALAVPREQRLEKCPFLIAQIESHDPPPPAVNHDPPCYSVNYVSTDPNIAMKIGDAVRNAVDARNESVTGKLSDIANSFARLIDSSRDGAGNAVNEALKGALDSSLRQAGEAIGAVASS